MLYRMKPALIDATRWWQNGDHPQDRVGKQELDEIELYRLHPELFHDNGEVGPVPEDVPTYTRREGAVVRYYRHPLVPGGSTCNKCDWLMHQHGWIDTRPDGITVCPGDWVITDGDRHYSFKPDIFDCRFELVSDAEIEEGIG